MSPIIVNRTLTEGSEFTRTDAPPLALAIPSGWLTNTAWMNQDAQPEPLVAVQNKAFAITDGDEATSLIPSELSLPADAAALTIMGVVIEPGATYMRGTASPASFSSADAPFVHSYAGGISTAFAWVTSSGTDWGYLIYRWLGPYAGSDATVLASVIDSIRFSA